MAETEQHGIILPSSSLVGRTAGHNIFIATTVAPTYKSPKNIATTVPAIHGSISCQK